MCQRRGEKKTIEQNLVAVLAVCPRETDFLMSPAPTWTEQSVPLGSFAAIQISSSLLKTLLLQMGGRALGFFPPVNSE